LNAVTQHTLSALYGLKYNPFLPEVPIEAIHVSPRIEEFVARMQISLFVHGGFAKVIADPGMGKSVLLRLLHERGAHAPDTQIAVITHPQSSLADFYRELGDLFNVPLRPHNRWGGFKNLRIRWRDHLQNTRRRPILLVDEAQEMTPIVLNELRLMSSDHFDSQTLLSVIIAGDRRLEEKLRRDDLLPLASRIRANLTIDCASREELLECLQHLMSSAGNANLMTKELCYTLADHALGNYRALTSMASELLLAAAQRELPKLDEKLYLQVFQPEEAPARRRTASAK
jgi:general secretion pathway protein A